MLTKIHLKNFKCWEDTGDISFSNITGFFGVNSSGKTSLLQSLLLFKQTADSPDRSVPLFLGDSRSLVDLGTMENILFGHDLDRNLSWEIEWRLTEELQLSDPKKPENVLWAGVKLCQFTELRPTEPLQLLRMGYRLLDDKKGKSIELGMQFVERPDRQEQGYELFPKYSKEAVVGFKRTPGRAWLLPKPNKFYGFPDEVRAYYQNAQILSDLELEFERLWSKIYYLGPLREYPHRQYLWSGIEPPDVGRRGERVVEAILASRNRGKYIRRWEAKKGKDTLEARIAKWLSELQLVKEFQIEALSQAEKLYRVLVRSYPDGKNWVPLTDVGFGVSQVLPVITLCYYVPEGSVIILEQPEIHLHPSVQAHLADVLIDAVETRQVQVILESHSEHLLRRLQRRIAEKKLSPEKVALYFVKMEKDVSRCEPLNLDLFGNIQNWPEGFFGDDFKEIAAMHQAILHRQQQEQSVSCQTG